MVVARYDALLFSEASKLCPVFLSRRTVALIKDELIAAQVNPRMIPRHKLPSPQASKVSQPCKDSVIIYSN
jgi:hypothetical protein